MKGNYKDYNKSFEKEVTACVRETFVDLMELNDVNEYDVAEETGIHLAYLRHILDGSARLGVWELYQMAEYFNVSIDELLRRG